MHGHNSPVHVFGQNGKEVAGRYEVSTQLANGMEYVVRFEDEAQAKDFQLKVIGSGAFAWCELYDRVSGKHTRKHCVKAPFAK